MNIIINTTIREKYNQGFSRYNPPSTIIIHGTAGFNTSEGLMQWMINGERAEEYKQGIALFHYLNDLEGDITEILNPDKWVYHSSSGNFDSNTIGIENLNASIDNSNPYTDKQYTSLVDLIIYLKNKYLTIKTIMSHNVCGWKYSKVTKICPGNFDWLALALMLEKKGISCVNLKYQEVINLK
jgi:hypothetical protein